MEALDLRFQLFRINPIGGAYVNCMDFPKLMLRFQLFRINPIGGVGG